MSVFSMVEWSWKVVNYTLMMSAGKITLLEEIGKLLERSCTVSRFGPEWGSEECVGVWDGFKGGLDEVTHTFGVSGGGGVTVVDSGHLQDSLDCWGSNDSGSSRSWNETDSDGSTFSGNLDWDGMGLSQVGSPVTSSDWHDGEFGEDDGSSDGGSDFLGALDSETDVTVAVSDDDKGLESGSLTCPGLFLNWHDLHHLILQSWEEVVDDLVLLDWQWVEVDLFDGLDLSGLDQSSELGHWDPLLLTIVLSTTASSTTTTTTASVTSTTTVTTSSEPCCGCWCCWSTHTFCWIKHADRRSDWREVRSKIWWLAEFCNSHCFSHFAAFFIVVGTNTYWWNYSLNQSFD